MEKYHSNETDKRNFPMVEIMITLAVIGLFSAIIVPNVIKETKSIQNITLMEKEQVVDNVVKDGDYYLEKIPNWKNGNFTVRTNAGVATALYLRDIRDELRELNKMLKEKESI